jgi:hypothetical protein
MHDIRCPYAKTPNLTIADYLKALVLALFEKPICVEYAAIAIKV